MNVENRPSKKQRELLSYIDAFIRSHGYGPSYREVMHALSYRSVSTVATHIDNLITKGHLRKRDHSARSLEVVESGGEFARDDAVTQIQEKWLIDLVARRFVAAETNLARTPKEVDDLYVLVGALQVLGMEDAARALKPRLQALHKAVK